jgi:hypothetical protein
MPGIWKLTTRAREILLESGPPGLLKATFSFLMFPLYERDRYFLYARVVKEATSLSDTEIGMPRSVLNCRIITSNEEADRLELDGFIFRSCPTTHNADLKSYRRWLDLGATAFCTFVDKEFAAIAWVILTPTTQNKMKAPPLKVQYDSHEAFPRAAWVNPKYRNLGLMRNTFLNRDRFLAARGIALLRVTVDYTNGVGKGMIEGLDGKVYGRAQWTRILWWRFWKEKHD